MTEPTSLTESHQALEGPQSPKDRKHGKYAENFCHEGQRNNEEPAESGCEWRKAQGAKQTIGKPAVESQNQK
jgi:hypothetical protein